MSDIRRQYDGWFSLTWIAWLFTIGVLDLEFWPAVWAFFIWPYYLGTAAARLVW